TQIAQIEYDLVITDYKMPGMNGLELAQIIRQKSSKTRVIMMTAYGTENLRSATKIMQLDGFLDKPVSIKEVRQIVRRALSKTKQSHDKSNNGRQPLSPDI